MKILTEKDFEDYFESTHNTDFYVCGCPCGKEFDWVHGFALRIQKDLRKKFKEEML